MTAPTAIQANEWPDPQFCIVDTIGAYTALNDYITGTLPGYAVTGYTLGNNTVVCTTANTSDLFVGDQVAFDGTADACLRAFRLIVTAVNANVSFTVSPEYDSLSSVVAITAASYHSGTGLATLTTASPVYLSAGQPVLISNVTGTGSFTALDGAFNLQSGSGTSTIVVQLATGLTLTLTGGSLQSYGTPIVNSACNVTISSMCDHAGSTGALTSYVTKTASAVVWVSDRSFHTALLLGCKRVIIVKIPAQGSADIEIDAPTDRVATFGGTTRAIGLAAYIVGGAASGSTAQCFINNGTFTLGGPVATLAARTWISYSQFLGNSPTIYHAGVRVIGTPGAYVVLGEFTEGPSLTAFPDGSFNTPRAQFIRFKASVSPYNQASFLAPHTGGWTMNFTQRTNGAIKIGTSALEGLLEGQTLSLYAGLASSDQTGSTVVYNPVMKMLINATGHLGDPTYYATTQGRWNLQPGGTSINMYATADTYWQFVDFDLHAAWLFTGP